MKHSEKDIQSKILKYLKKLKDSGEPIYYERRQAGGFSYKTGLPDIYFIYYGLHIEVEVKSSTGKLSSMQETWERIFIKNNTPHVVIDNFESFKKVINKLYLYSNKIENLSKLMLQEIREVNN